MNKNSNSVQRVIGFDSHPDSFTAALLRGQTPAQALTEKTFNKVPMAQLQSWAKKHTTTQDLFVLEASGNSFHIVRSLAAIERKALVLESSQMGKLKEAHANNDKISAVRIGKAYLAGTAKVVWVPDPKTQERRDWFHAHQKAVRRSTQMRNRIKSYLSDNGVRLKKGVRLVTQAQAAAEEQFRQLKDWSARQWQVLEGMLMELRHAEEQRKHWRSLVLAMNLRKQKTHRRLPAVGFLNSFPVYTFGLPPPESCLIAAARSPLARFCPHTKLAMRCCMFITTYA